MIEPVEDVNALQEVVELLCAVWGVDRRQPPVRRDMLRALAHAGNYVDGAAADGRLVGAIVGFLGHHDQELVLHSHILGVVEGMQGRSVGLALKQHQRWWCLARGLDHVRWTFDPLVRRNARFNLNRLGARIVAYHPSFYGPMEDGINSGDETDRCVVSWPSSTSGWCGRPKEVTASRWVTRRPERPWCWRPVPRAGLVAEPMPPPVPQR